MFFTERNKMNDFFKTFFTKTKATVAKVGAGIGIGLMTVATVATTIPLIPIEWRIAAGLIVGVGSMLGLHAVHRADKPVVPLGSQKMAS